MGVPGFFLWLWKNYKKNSFVFTKSKIEKEKDKTNLIILDELNNIDYFLIDTNCLIHPMCFKILAENNNLQDNNSQNNNNSQDKLEAKMINKVIEFDKK